MSGLGTTKPREGIREVREEGGRWEGGRSRKNRREGGKVGRIGVMEEKSEK